MVKLRRAARILLIAVAAYYALVLVALVYLRFLPPLTTGVHVQRRVESLFSDEDYRKRYRFVRLGDISDHLEHAVIAAEDGRFYEHRGFDLQQMRRAREEAERRGEPPRGASTLTQQLVKNLFFTTHRSYVRKGLELTITPLAELVLGKQRILELYLNVVEWGVGVYGAEAAAQRYYDTTAADLGRERSARLAALLPAPRTRMPDEMSWYSSVILQRMSQMGW